MNPNPSIIVVSLVTRAIVSRTTWADWAIDNGECVSLTECGRLANELRAKGCVEVNDHLLIDVTPGDTAILRYLSSVAEANKDAIREVIASGHVGTCAYFIACSLGGCAENQSAGTIAEAVAKIRANILSPKDLAEKKRAQAETLLREADELHPAEKTAA